MLTTDTSPSPAAAPVVVPASPARAEVTPRRRPWLFVAFSVLLILCFIRPLYDLIRFALHSDLYSHILLIPFISIYLAWLNRKRQGESVSLKSAKNLRVGRVTPCAPQSFADANGAHGVTRPTFLALFAMGAAALASYFWIRHSAPKLPAQDYLALTTFSFLCVLVGGYTILLSKQTLRALRFPFAFLIFMIPFPTFLEHTLAGLLQRGSADAAYVFLKLSGMPVFKAGMEFQLPGFSMHVAPECSGIHSSLALFIASLLAANLLLTGGWPRAILTLAVVPLGILRNGFRIFVLGQLCVRVDPNWINSDLHHRGGPIFFVLSLVPFFLLLLWLRKKEVQKLKSRTVG